MLFFTTLAKIESVASRNEMTAILAEFFLEVKKEDIAAAVYLMQGRVAPSYEPIEFGMSNKSVLAALDSLALEFLSASFDNLPSEEFNASSLLKELGDIGLVCETLLHKLPSINNSFDSLKEIHENLLKITQISGAGSQLLKQESLQNILKRLNPLAGRYICRVITGELRLGVSEKTIFDALSWAIDGTKKHREIIERAYGARSDLGYISSLVKEALDSNFKDANPQEKDANSKLATIKTLTTLLSQVKLQTGVPVASKLCEREDTAKAVFKRLETCILQPKLDGMRAQIHFQRERKSNSANNERNKNVQSTSFNLSESTEVKQIYSRNQESLTDAFPDILEVLEHLDCDSCIIDSEVVGYDYDSDSYLSYQETMTRRRKHGVSDAQTAVPLKSMAFDLLYLNGEDLTETPVEVRLEKLKTLLENSKNQNRISLLETVVVNSENELEEYFQAQIAQGLEGILCKKMGTNYAPGSRNYDWIKLKANTQESLVDTIDVVVIGYFAGTGERAKYGFGSLLTAVYDDQLDMFVSVAKVGSGFTDELAPQIRGDLERLRVNNKPENVEVVKSLTPDYWVTPEIVIEVVADEITRSPAHVAAKNLKADFEKDLSGKGLSLRFPRIKIWNRDKRANQATNTKELLRLFELRKNRLLGLK